MASWNASLLTSGGAEAKVLQDRVQTCGHLQYKSFCVVWFQVFSLPAPFSVNGRSLCEPIESDIDRQIFDRRFLEQNLISRFRLKGFDVKIQLNEREPLSVISGHVHIEAAIFFNTTVSLTYRLVVSGEDGFCRTNKQLTSDDIIILAGIPLGIEHSYPSDETAKRSWGVELKVSRLEISGLFLNIHGAVLDDPITIYGSNEVCLNAMNRYKAFFLGKEHRSQDSRFVLIDIWEDLSHSSTQEIDFSQLSAPEILAHIIERHKDELMGLLTLYPFEWPYRDERAFHRICGENIAIDTDDLVLVSDNVGLIIGTYGLRGVGSPTDWRGYLRERRSLDHVCWPECLHILEIAVAQLHTINYALHKLHAISLGEWRGLDSKALIRRNSLLALTVSRMIADMDVVTFSRYASHKRMYKEIEERLAVREEIEVLIGALSRVDMSIKNIDNLDELRQSRIIRLLLAFITIASIFQVLFQELRLPILSEFWGDAMAKATAINVLALVGLGLVLISGAAILAGIVRIGSALLKRIYLRR